MGRWYNGKTSLLLLLLAGILLGAFLLAMGIGAVHIAPLEIIGILAAHLPFAGAKVVPSAPPEHDVIITTVRLPRILLAAMVGAGLALAGATLQGLFRNPMADPYIIGVSSGAALGAVASILLQVALHTSINYAIPALGFFFALLTIILVYNLARVGAKVPVMTLLLAGIAVNSLLSALVSLCMFFSGSQLHQVMFWLLGGFSGRGWDYVFMFLPYGLLGATIILVYARELNAMLLGEEAAQHLGIEVESVKRWLLAAAAVLTGACVSVSGLIGFVGLVIPHVVRILMGPDHRQLLPAVALVGAIFLLAADMVSRIIIVPGEMPVGIVTALVGGPFFIYLLRRHKNAMF